MKYFDLRVLGLISNVYLQVFDGIKTEFPYTGDEDKIDKPPPAVPPNISPNGPSLDNATANLLQVCLRILPQ